MRQGEMRKSFVEHSHRIFPSGTGRVLVCGACKKYRYCFQRKLHNPQPWQPRWPS